MLRDKLTLQEILLGFENTLKIEYTHQDTAKVVKLAVQRIESAIGCTLSDNIYDDQLSTQLIGDSIDIFLSQVIESMKSLSILLSITLFDKRYGENLRDLNYLGFSEKELKLSLKYLQDSKLTKQRKTFFNQIVTATAKIGISEQKRLLTIMAVLERLGIEEAVALIAQYLYIGLR